MTREHYSAMDILSLTEAAEVFGISVKTFKFNV